MSSLHRSARQPDYMRATEDFNKARNKAFLSKIQNILSLERDNLLSFYDVKDILKPKGEYYRGMQSVPISLIVGSEGRYRDFNKTFLPRSEFLRSRWERVDRAQIQDIPLPAIQLYEIGGVYFVRDGNHRVSVARSQGVEEIDAEVTSLSSEIAISPGMASGDIRQSVIDYEKKIFYEKTGFGKITGDYDLTFTAPGRYDLIYTHITVHKYFLNQDTKQEIPLDEAILSWYSDIFLPIIKIIKKYNLVKFFPGQSSSDLYIWIVKYWDFIKKKKGPYYSIDQAARDFSRKYGKGRKSFRNFLDSILGHPGKRR